MSAFSASDSRPSFSAVDSSFSSSTCVRGPPAAVSSGAAVYPLCSERPCKEPRSPLERMNNVRTAATVIRRVRKWSLKLC